MPQGQVSKQRLVFGIRGIALALHILLAILIVSFLGPLMRLTHQELVIMVWGVTVPGILGSIIVTVYRERAVRILSRFLDGVEAGTETDENSQESFAVLVNLPRGEALLGLMVWGSLALPICGLLYLISDTFVIASVVVMGISCSCAGALASTLIFVTLKNFLVPYCQLAASRVPDPGLREQLVKRIPLGVKLSVAIGSLVAVVAFFGVSYTQTRMLSTVETLTTSGHVDLLDQVGQGVFANLHDESSSLGSYPLTLELGTANLLVVSRETGEVVRGDAERIFPGEVRALLDTEEPSGDSSIFNSSNDFSWMTSPDGSHVLISISPSGGLGFNIQTVGLWGALWAFVTVLLAIILARFQTVDITRSVAALREQVDKVSSGDLRPGDILEAEDDFGELARGFEKMRRSLRTTVEQVTTSATRVEGSAQSIAEASSAVAASSGKQGNSIREISDSMAHIHVNTESIEGSAEALEASVRESTSTIGDMGVTGGALANSSAVLQDKVASSATAFEKMYESIARVVECTEILASASEGATGGVEEMAATLKQVDVNAVETSRLSDQVLKSAEQGEEKVLETIQGIRSIQSDTAVADEIVRELGGRTVEIGSIANVISNVADETNLLALNAAIIAAQAGEHGRAFSVVADEIKALAERVLISTKEISRVITAVQEGTERAVTAIDSGAHSVSAGVALSEEAGTALYDINRAARESGTRMQEVVTAVQQQSAAAQHVSELVAEMGDAVDEIRRAGGEQSTSTNEVATSNRAMSEAAEEVSRSTDDQGRSSGEIAESVERVQQVVEEIAHALSEQAGAVHEVTQLMEELNLRARENEISTQQMSKTVEDLQGEAVSLREGIRRFKV